jgi:hypothetical protein
MNAGPFPPQHDQHRVEIELDSVVTDRPTRFARRDLNQARPRLGARGLVAVAALLAAAVTVTSIVVAVTDPFDERVSPSSPAPDRSQQITTPPTLVALATLPLAPALVDQGTRQERPAGRAAPLWRVPTAALAEFDLDTAVSGLADDVARRSRTRYAFDDRSIEAVIVHDPTSGLDDVVLTAADSRLRFVIDRATSTAYLDRTSDALRSEAAWDAVGGDRFVRPPDGLTLGDWIDRLMLGPITPTSSAGATVVASDWLTSIGDGIGVARRFEVRLPPSEAPTWVDFPFDGVAAASGDELGPWADDDTEAVELEAFVGQGSDLIVVNGAIGIGDGLRSFTHQLARVPNPVRISLPPDRLAIVLAAPAPT